MATGVSSKFPAAHQVMQAAKHVGSSRPSQWPPQRRGSKLPTSKPEVARKDACGSMKKRPDGRGYGDSRA